MDIETRAELLKINARWASTKEPVDYVNNRIDIGGALVLSRETIPLGEDAVISIAVKKQDKNPCFAFNNEGYLFAWKKPQFELSQQRYIVQLRIAAEGKEWKREFLMLNLDNNVANFRLAPRN